MNHFNAAIRRCIIAMPLMLLMHLFTINVYAIVNTNCSPQCVTYIKNLLPQGSKWKNITIGNAYNWYDIASLNEKGALPQVPSVIVFYKWDDNQSGHVGIVKKITGDILTIEHANWGNDCKVAIDEFKFVNNSTGLTVLKNNKTYNIKGFVYTWLSSKFYGLINFGEKLKTIENIIGEKAIISGSTGFENIYFVNFSRYPGIEFRVDDEYINSAYIKTTEKFCTKYGEVYKGMPISKIKNIISRSIIEKVDNPESHTLYKIKDNAENSVIVFYVYDGNEIIDGIGFGLINYVYAPTD